MSTGRSTAAPQTALAGFETNRAKLVRLSVVGEVTPPRYAPPPANPYRISTDGEPRVLPGTGGVTYNVRLGHRVRDIVGDHVEPAVSMKNPDDGANGGLNVLACIGNRATVLGGEAAGTSGVVTGKHGGAEHVMVDFPPDALERMIPGDRILVKSFGTGLAVPDVPDLKCMSLDPDFLDHWALGVRNGKLVVPVTHRVPAAIMGSGLGRDNAYRGDYDITMFDDETVAEHGLEDLRLGDLVAIVDADASYGRYLRRGSVTVGIIAHGDSIIAGHGPGVTCLLTSRSGAIEPVVDAGANIGHILGLL
ncbi:MAG TPA: DUF4438 domain-containing protein [Thermomicrobiaceae bacterium]|nr:DUF4438 domain-containing protein [Thermomicrobiaceae bacterium]